MKMSNVLNMKIIPALGLALGLVACSASAKNEEIPMKKFTDQPYVSLDINGEGCSFVVLVNNIPVYRQYDIEPILLELPVNQYMKSGINSIQIGLDQPEDGNQQPLKGKTCSVKLDYLVKEKGSDNQYKLGELNYVAPSDKIFNTPNKEYIKGSTSSQFLEITNNKVEKTDKEDAQFQIGDPNIQANNESYFAYNFDIQKVQKQKGALVENTLNIRLPYDNKVLTEGETLENNETTRQELIQVYKQIISDIGKKDFAALKPMFEPVMQNNSVSLYLPESQTNVLGNIEETANDSHYKLYKDINFDNTVLNIFGNDRLAQLTWWDSTAILGFNKVGEEGSTSYSLTFAKINGKWKVVL